MYENLLQNAVASFQITWNPVIASAASAQTKQSSEKRASVVSTISH